MATAEPFRLRAEEPSPAPWKPSLYTVPVSGDALFNTVTCAYLRPSERQWATYRQVVAGVPATDEECVRDLHGWGFVLGGSVRELATLQVAFHSSIRSRKPPLLTIAPTLDCNFGCEYCFETHKPGLMAPDVRDGLINLLRERHAADEPVPLTVTWFGGEPLMAMPVIEDLASRFDGLVKDGVLTGWDATVVTNGLTATPKVVKRLVERNLTSIQVTIDGPREIHDRRRILKNGKPTFDRICANLAALPEGLEAMVRVNVDRRNMGALTEMMEQLEAAGVLARPASSVYLAIVEDYDPGPEAVTNVTQLHGHFLSSREFAAAQLEFLKMARDRGWRVTGDVPTPNLRGVCQVDNVNAYVIAPTGELMKCWAELGNNPDVVAHLLRPETWATPHLSPLEDRDPFDDPECRDCQLLPICMGGCPFTRSLRRNVGRKECPPVKYRFEELLNAAVLNAEVGAPHFTATPKYLELSK